MASTFEKGQDRIENICRAIKEETLEPARQEGNALIAAARKEAEAIIAKAKGEAAASLADARSVILKERTVFESSLHQAAKVTVESLRQQITEALFNPELEASLSKESGDLNWVAKLLTAIVQAVDKEGLGADLSAIVPKSVTPSAVNAALAKNIVDRLKAHPITIGQFSGGCQVKVHNKKLTLDISDGALTETLVSYLRKDFRDLIFARPS